MSEDKPLKPIRVKDRVAGAPATRDIHDRNGNTRFRRVVTDINKQRRLHKPHSDRFTVTQAGEIYAQYGGRCCFCGRTLNMGISYGDNKLNLIYYIPLEAGGEHSIFNIVPCCTVHLKERTHKPVLREEIPDINTFADHVAVLIESTIEFKINPTAPMAEKIKRIKRIINFSLDEIAINMSYKPFEDWLPEQFEILIEDHNTIPDRIETMVKDSVDEKPEDVLQSDKEYLTDAVKQVVVSRKHMFVRNPKEK